MFLRCVNEILKINVYMTQSFSFLNVSEDFPPFFPTNAKENWDTVLGTVRFNGVFIGLIFLQMGMAE